MTDDHRIRKLSGKIKQYWDERAKGTEPASAQATTYDVFLRDLEIAKFKQKISEASLPEGSTVVDLGCGDGYATVNVAAAFPTLRFIGIDWSEDMLALARKRCTAHSGLAERMSFRQGDMRRVSDVLNGKKFEVFLTSRSLINLMYSEEQYGAIEQIAEHLKPGGYYFGIENFMQGQNNFNAAPRGDGAPRNSGEVAQPLLRRAGVHRENREALRFAGVRELSELLLSRDAGHLLRRLSLDGRGAGLFPSNPPDCRAAASDRRLLPHQIGEHAAEVLIQAGGRFLWSVSEFFRRSLVAAGAMAVGVRDASPVRNASPSMLCHRRGKPGNQQNRSAIQDHPFNAAGSFDGDEQIEHDAQDRRPGRRPEARTCRS